MPCITRVPRIEVLSHTGRMKYHLEEEQIWWSIFRRGCRECKKVLEDCSSDTQLLLMVREHLHYIWDWTVK